MPEFLCLGASQLRVSALGLGSLNFGHDLLGCDERESLRIIKSFLDAGFNFIDTANTYGDGRSEIIVGHAVKNRRDSVVIATKVGLALGPLEGSCGRTALMTACDDSLRRLDTSYIDLYQLHRYDPHTPLEETLEALDALIRQGKIRHWGVCNWTAAQVVDAVRLAEIHNFQPPTSDQLQYSLIYRQIEVELIPTCNKHDVAVIPCSPLCAGVLTGKYQVGREPPAGTRIAAAPERRRLYEQNDTLVRLIVDEASKLGITAAALSFAWLMRRPGIVAPLIGPKTVEQLRQYLDASRLDVPAETLERLSAATKPALYYPHDWYTTVRMPIDID